MSINSSDERGRGAYSERRGRRGSGQHTQSHHVSWQIQDGPGTISRELFPQLPEEMPENDLSRCVKYYQNIEKELRQWYALVDNEIKLAEQTHKIWDRIFEYIAKMLKVSDVIFSQSTEYYLRKEIDSRLWKYGIYQYIKVLKDAPIALQSWRDGALKALLETGLKHFGNMLKVLVPQVLNIELEPVFTRTAFLRESVSEESTRDFIYRIFIIMGDLYRYRHASFLDRHDEKMALSMYTGARFCDPDKTRAYNQLGLVARFQGDIVAMVYLFIRASETNTPIEGASSQLKMIFGEVAAYYVKRKSTYWFTRAKQTDKELSQERQTRCDIWISSTDPAGLHEIFPLPPLPPNRHEHVKSLTTEEVYSRFSLAFGHFIGMLYTNIGTESLEHVGKELLVYFEGLVKIKNYVRFQFYVEVIGILIYMKDYLKPPKTDRKSQSKSLQLKYLGDKTLELTMTMLMIMMEKLLDLVRGLKWESPMLTSCCACFYVWCNWAKRHKKVQGEILAQLFSTTRIATNFLACSVRLHDGVKHLNGKRRYGTFPILKSQRDNNCTELLKILPEIVVLDGFYNVVVDTDKHIQCFYESVFPKEKADLQYRFFAIDKFLAAFIRSTDAKPLTESGGNYEPTACVYQLEFKILNTIHQKKIILEVDGQRRRPDCNNARIIVRRPSDTQKEQLTIPKGFQLVESLTLVTRFLNDFSEVNAQLALMGVKTEMFIKPVRVVLDTNTLIRQLDWIKLLIYILPYRLIIPTTVLLELRGLAKGAKSGMSPIARQNSKSLSPAEQKIRMENAMVIGEDCEQALEFLDEHKRYLRLIAISGKEIKMYKYKSQRVFDKRLTKSIRNDEKILETCVQLELQDKSLRELDNPFRIHRGTVLLTNDKALRVRAFALDMPAQGIQAFATWIMKYRIKNK